MQRLQGFCDARLRWKASPEQGIERAPTRNMPPGIGARVVIFISKIRALF